jgi:acyl carrier protein
VKEIEETAMDVHTTLRKFIEEGFAARRGKKDLSNDDSLLDSGLIDSAGIFELVGFLERSFNIQVDDAEIVPEHFESVNSLAAFVNSKQGR